MPSETTTQFDHISEHALLENADLVALPGHALASTQVSVLIGSLSVHAGTKGCAH